MVLLANLLLESHENDIFKGFLLNSTLPCPWNGTPS